MRNEAHKVEQVSELIATAFLFVFVLVQPISIAATYIACVGAAFAWVMRLILVRRRVLHSSPLDALILAYLLLCAVSTMRSSLPASSWEGMRKVVLVFLVLLVAHNVPNARRAKRLVTLLFVSGLASVAWAGWQYSEGVGLRVHNPEPGTGFYRAGVQDNDVVLRVDGRLIRRPEQFLAHLNSKSLTEPLRLRVVHGSGVAILKDAVPVEVPPGEWPRANSVDKLGMRMETVRPARAMAFYSHYVSYAFLLELLASLAFGLWLGRRRRFSVSALIFAGLLLVFAMALGATLTRAAWLALAFGCAVQAWFHLKHWSIRLLLPLALLLAFVGTNAAMHRWRGMAVIDRSDPGTEYRILMWRDGLRLIKEHPWFGLGMNTVRDAWWRFDLAAYKKYGLRLHFHSTPIQIAVDMGLPVLISWIFLMGCYWLMLVRLVARAREQGDPFLYGLTLGILGGTSGFLAGSLMQYDFGDSVVVLLFWFLAGLALAVRGLLHGKNFTLAGSTP